LDYEKRYRELEAELNYYSVKKDLFLDGLKLLKKEIAQTDDKIGELTKELLEVIEFLRKS
jgi:hypothetical protein